MDNIERIRNNPPEVMSVVEAGIYMGISDKLIRKLIKDGKLRCRRNGPTGKILIRKEWVDDYLNKDGE